MKIILLIFFIILFIPIPIWFSISYSKENYYIKLFSLNLIKKNDTKNYDKKKKEKKIQKKKNNKFLKKVSPKTIVKALNRNKFKPFIRIKGHISYSLNDAANTAILYGFLSSLFPILLRIIKIPFKIKKISLPIEPLFNNENLVNFEIKSIICFSFVQIIYIFFLIIKEIINETEAKYYV